MWNHRGRSPSYTRRRSNTATYHPPASLGDNQGGMAAPESESMLHNTYKKEINQPEKSWSRHIEALASVGKRPPRKLVYAIVGAIIVIIIMLASVETHVVKINVSELNLGNLWHGLHLEEWHNSRAASLEHKRKAVVLASYHNQNVSWLHELNSSLTSGWEIYRYVNDVTPENATLDEIALSSPTGREGLAYITYIIDHYEDLPDYVVFVHGHERSWHQPVPMADRLSALSLDIVEEEHYVSIQCHGGGCSPNDLFIYNGTASVNPRLGMKLEDFWDVMMLPHGFGHLPYRIGRQCCAQFAVHRDAILKHDLQFWLDFRDPLLGYDHERPEWHSPILPGFDNLPGHRVGLFYEMIWHIIFGKEHVHCPTHDWCEKVLFQDLIHCPREITGWLDQKGWQNMTCTNDLREQAKATDSEDPRNALPFG